jgi:uncharacterized membrane protein
MPSAQKTVLINRPAGEVFAFIADGENDPKWRPDVIDIAHVPGTGTGLGARYRQGVKGPGGTRIAADYEITAYEPDRLLAFRTLEGPVRSEGEYLLDASGAQTSVTLRLSWQPGGMARLLAPVVARAMESEVESLTNLRSLLEKSAGS